MPEAGTTPDIVAAEGQSFDQDLLDLAAWAYGEATRQEPTAPAGDSPDDESPPPGRPGYGQSGYAAPETPGAPSKDEGPSTALVAGVVIGGLGLTALVGIGLTAAYLAWK